MGCCRNLFSKRQNSPGSVICLKWVLPLRIVVLVGLLSSTIYAVSHADQLSMLAVLLLIIQLIISSLILAECQRSVIYHSTMKRMSGNLR